MCGRYTLFETDKLTGRFQAVGTSDDLRDNYNVAPGQFMPVVTPNAEGKNELTVMKWGMVPVWAKDDKVGYKLINARSEEAFDKPTWRGPLKSHRCLIPATGFYEWRKTDGKTKQPFFIRPADQELFAFAGIYSTWKSPEGFELQSYSIMTTAPNREMAAIHDRMPVILHPEDEDSWLLSSPNDRGAIEALLRPYEDGKLLMHEVSSDVNVVRNNDKVLIYPLNSQ
jgi:putative SOS response-associated peptidase YedK